MESWLETGWTLLSFNEMQSLRHDSLGTKSCMHGELIALFVMQSKTSNRIYIYSVIAILKVHIIVLNSKF